VINEQYQPSRGHCASAWRRWAPAGFLCVGLLGALASPSLAGTYYVAPSGNDGNNGSSGSPWKSVGKAARTAVAGDTVIFRAGTYNEPLQPANAGTGENSRIVFKAAPGEEVIIDGGTERLTGWTSEGNHIYHRNFSGYVFGMFEDDYDVAGKFTNLWDMGSYNQYDSNPNFDLHDFDPSHDLYAGQYKKHDWRGQYKYANGVMRVATFDGKSPDEHDVRAALHEIGLIINKKPYVTVDGLKFRRFKTWFAIDDSPHTRVMNCDLRFSAWTGVWVTRSDNTEILNNVMMGGGCYVGHYEDTIHLTDTVGSRWEGNDISYGGHGTFFFDHGTQSIIRNNFIHDAGGSMLTMKFSADNNTIENNVFARAPFLSEVNCHMTAHAAIQLAGGSNNTFQENLLYHCGNGFLISCNQDEKCNGNHFYNNTIVNSGNDGIQLQGYDAQFEGHLNDNVFKNNIIDGAGLLILRLDLPGGDKNNYWGNRFSNNLFLGTALGAWGSRPNVAEAQSQWPTVFQNNLEVDPRFVNAGSNDYHLQPGSPAIDHGVSVGLSFAGSAPDIGVFEMNGTGKDPGLPSGTDPVVSSPVPPVSGPSGTDPPVALPNQAPTAAATATPTSGNVPLSVQFSGSATDSDGQIAKYVWDFGDGVLIRNQNPAHTYTNAGDFTATLTVTDDGGATASASVPIHAQSANRPPTVTVQATPRLGNAPLTVQFTSAASDPDGGSLSYRWDFGDGQSSTAQNPSHLYNGSGDFTARLTVTDDKGATASGEVTIKVDGAGQAPVVSITANPTSGNAPLTVQLNGSATDSDGQIVSYAWNFGDGESSANPVTSHVYTQKGSYVATLTATDNGGATGSKSVTITVGEGSDTSVTLKPAADAYVRDGSYADQNFGADAYLMSKLTTQGLNRQTFLAFDLSGITQKIKTAKLRLFSSYNAQKLEVHAVNDDGWQEGQITWNNKPTPESAAVAQYDTIQNQFVEVDVTSYMQTEQATSNKRACIALLSTVMGAAAPLYSSKEADEERCPQLVLALAEDAITTQPAPEPPPVPGPPAPSTTPSTSGDTPPVAIGPVTLNPVADAYTRDGWFNLVNFGTTDSLWVASGRYTSNRRSLLKFDLSRLPGGTIGSAKLRIYVKRNLYTGESISVFSGLDDAWEEPQVNWMNQPQPDLSRPLGAIPVNQDSGYLELDVTEYLQWERSGGGNNTATFILQAALWAATELGSRESDTGKPELVVTMR
jgi:PKD repeat protein